MYVPEHFRASDQRAAARALIEAFPFAQLVTVERGEPVISSLPMFVCERDGRWFVRGHLARLNPQASHGGRRATAYFTGAHGYISPSWYALPSQSVPTWNYGAVSCAGTLRVLADDACDEVLRTLTARHEARFDVPWSPDRLDPQSYARLRQNVTAFELEVESLDVKLKYGQNRSAEDRAGVIHALGALGGSDAALARAMEANAAG